MSSDDWAVLLVEVAAPAQTAFLLIYGSGIWSKWWRSLIGRALFTKALALALLLDLTVFAELFGYDYPYHEQTTLMVVALIAVGSWLQLIALLVDLRAGSRHRFSPPPNGRH